MLPDAGDEEDGRRLEVWRQGMAALSQLPHVHVKISQLWYTAQGWRDRGSAAHTLIRQLVKEVGR